MSRARSWWLPAAAVVALTLMFATARSGAQRVVVYDGPLPVTTRPATTRPATGPAMGPTIRVTTRPAGVAGVRARGPAAPAPRAEVSTFPIPPAAVLAGHRMDLKWIVYSRDGRRLASASEDKTVRLWDAEGGKELHVFEGHTAGVLGVDFSPDGELLVSGGLDAMAKVWEVRTGEQVAEFAAHPRRVNCVAFHPDGKHVLTGCCDHLLRVWDVASETVVAKFRHDDCVRSVAVTGDGAVAAVGMEHGRIHLWELKSEALLTTLTPRDERPAMVECVRFSEDGSRLVSSSWNDGQVAWDWKNGKQAVVYRDGGRGQVAITPDGKTVAVAHGRVDFYEAASGKMVATVDLPRGGFDKVVFSPDGKRVAVGGDIWRERNRSEDVVVVWDLKAVLEKCPAAAAEE